MRDRGRLRFRGRLPVRGRVRVRVKPQEVPGAEPTAGQWSPRRAELRAQGTVPVRIPVSLPRTHVVPPVVEEASGILSGAGAGLGNDMVGFKVPCRVTLHGFWTPGA